VSAVLPLKKSVPWQDESVDGAKKVNRQGIEKIIEIPGKLCFLRREQTKKRVAGLLREIALGQIPGVMTAPW
jgi:hypothetical protein